MKKTLLIGLLIIAAFFAGCKNPDIAVVEVTNPDGANIAFSGFYSSNQVDSTNVTGTTPMKYEIDVDAEDDYVVAGFTKTTVTDSESELKVELSYMGDIKDVETATIPIVGWAIVSADIP